MITLNGWNDLMMEIKLFPKSCSIWVKIITFIYQTQSFMTKLAHANNQGNWTRRIRHMAKSPKIGQKFDLLTHKIVLNLGENYQLYTSM